MFTSFHPVVRAEAKDDVKPSELPSSSEAGVPKEVTTQSTSSDSKIAIKPDPLGDLPPDSPWRHPYFWMTKPCHIYKEEYKDCKSFKERFNQYFIYGEMQDCSHWNEDYQNCKLWEDKKDGEALERLIQSEKDRVKVRLHNHYSNDVWENRKKPPADWNKELPQCISEGYETSYLKKMRDELKMVEEDTQNPDTSKPNRAKSSESSCAVM